MLTVQMTLVSLSLTISFVAFSLSHTLDFSVCICQSPSLPPLANVAVLFPAERFSVCAAMSPLCFKEQERMRINEADVNRLHTEVIPPKYSGPFQKYRDVAPKSIRH